MATMNHPYNLGSYFDLINAGCNEPETWFNRGLIWLYAFDLEMSYRCFEQAALLNPADPMAYWGMAYSSGMYYNKPWERMQQDELKETLQRSYRHSRQALQYLSRASERDAMLIDALQYRYQHDAPVEQQHYRRWNDEYADKMRDVYRAHPKCNDICSLFADALMTRTPWELWDLQTGKPSENASTMEAIDVLQTAMARIEGQKAQAHPGILHGYIHALEMSPFPEKALRASDQLRELVPGAGHLCHMPSHIDVRCGNYYQAIVANDKAIAADRAYVENEGSMNFQTLSRIHNIHLKVYAAMFLGQFRTALQASQQLIDMVPEALLRIENPAMADWMEGYLPVKAHVCIRFGKWEEIIEHPLPEDSELYSMTTAVWLYAKAISHAVRGETDLARKGRKAFRQAAKRVPATRYLFNNTCLDILKIADQMLDGELAYREGDFDKAFSHLRRAVYLDDHLKYDEPWGWMQPARHALGALLLEQGRVEEALEVYRDDLGLSGRLASTSHHIDNPWSLHGLVECYRRIGDEQAAQLFSTRLNLAAARADVDINASCACRLDHHDCCK